MQTGFQRPVPRQDKKCNNTIFFYPCTKFPDNEAKQKLINQNQTEKMRAKDICKTLINMHFESQMFTHSEPVYKVWVVYTVPINLKLGASERFQHIEDGKGSFNYDEMQRIYNRWSYKNNIVAYSTALKNNTLKASLPINGWELTLNYLNPILKQPFCFVVSTPDNNLQYIPCFNSIIRDEKKLHLLAAIQDKIDQLESQKHNVFAARRQD